MSAGEGTTQGSRCAHTTGRRLAPTANGSNQDPARASCPARRRCTCCPTCVRSRTAERSAVTIGSRPGSSRGGGRGRLPRRAREILQRWRPSGSGRECPCFAEARATAPLKPVPSVECKLYLNHGYESMSIRGGALVATKTQDCLVGKDAASGARLLALASHSSAWPYAAARLSAGGSSGTWVRRTWVLPGGGRLVGVGRYT